MLSKISLLIFCAFLPSLVLAQTGKLQIVSAATMQSSAIAAGSIVAIFGSGLATQTLSATDTNPSQSGLQLPKQLGGITIDFVDTRTFTNAGADLYFVSPTQINAVVPLLLGNVRVDVRVNGSVVASTNLTTQLLVPEFYVVPVGRARFALAEALRIVNNTESYTEPLFAWASMLNQFMPLPAKRAADNERLFLTLYVSGIRSRSTLPSVSLTACGFVLSVAYAGPMGVYPGIDQLNVETSRALAGKGACELKLCVESQQQCVNAAYVIFD